MAAIRFVAGDEDAGKRLDVRLAAEPEVGSRAKAQRMIDAGLVTVDGRPRPKSHALVGGETVEALSEPAPDPAEGAFRVPSPQA